MKIEKYILHLFPAIDMASKRMNIPSLSFTQLALLYMIKLKQPCRMGLLFELSQESQHAIKYQTLSVALMFLKKHELIQLEGTLYSLTYRGRDYLSYIRRYLLHKRL